MYKGYLRLPFSPVSAYDAVPHSSALVIECAPYTKAARVLNSAPYSGLAAWSCVQKIGEDTDLLQKIVEKSKPNLLASGRLIAAAQVSKANDFDYIYILDKLTEPLQLAGFAQDLVAFQPNKHNYKSQTVYSFTFGSGRALSVCEVRGIVIAARETYLVEYAIDQLNNYQNAISNDPDFKAVAKGLDPVAAVRVFFQSAPSAALAALYCNTKTIQNAFPNLQSVGKWAGIVPRIAKYGLSLTGFLQPNNAFMEALQSKNAASDLSIASVLPDNTACFAQFNVGDFATFYHRTGDNNSNINRYFASNIDHSFTYLLTEPTGEDFTNNHILLFKINDAVKTAAGMRDWSRALGKEEIIAYQNTTIQHLAAADFSKNLFGAGFDVLHNPYFTIIDKYLAFANTNEALQVLIDKYNFNQNLANEPQFIDFLVHNNTFTNAFLYARPARCMQLLRAFAAENTAENYQQYFAQWSIFQQVALSLRERDGVLIMQTVLQPSGNEAPKAAEKTTLQAPQNTASLNWKVQLQAAARTKPILVKNATNNETEILVQDIKNRIYLISRSGTMLWSRQLDEPILGSVQQIDLFTNKELEYLFNTKSKIYAIDRNGKDAQNYPIKLGVSATNGLVCVDYDGERKYFVYMACSNGNMYGFEKGGKPISGWNPLLVRGWFSRILQSFVANKREYLVAISDKGTLYAYNRYGSPQFSPVILTAPTLSAAGIDLLSDPIKISVCDTAGNLNIVTLDGKRSLGKVTVGNNRNVRMAVSDVGGDALKEYLVISAKQLCVYGYRNRQFGKWWGADLNDPLDDVFEVGIIGNAKQNIGLLSRTAKHFYLLDENGVLYPGFPINATTRCTISDLFEQRTNVLVGACDDVVYAYTIQ